MVFEIFWAALAAIYLVVGVISNEISKKHYRDARECLIAAKAQHQMMRALLGLPTEPDAPQQEEEPDGE